MEPKLNGCGCPLGMLDKRSSPMRQAEDRTRSQNRVFQPRACRHDPDEGTDLLPISFKASTVYLGSSKNQMAMGIPSSSSERAGLAVEAFESNGNDQVWSFFLICFEGRGAPSASSYGKERIRRCIVGERLLDLLEETGLA